MALTAQWRGAQVLYGQDISAVSTSGKHASIPVGHGPQARTSAFDGVVVCAGTASRDLAAQFGDRVYGYTVKGYPITVNLNDAQSNASAPTPNRVTSRLGNDRFRGAGMAQFNGYNRNMREDRIRPLVDRAQQCVAGVRTERVVHGAGLRPMLPNRHVASGSWPSTLRVLQHGPWPPGPDLVRCHGGHDWRHCR